MLNLNKYFNKNYNVKNSIRGQSGNKEIGLSIILIIQQHQKSINYKAKSKMFHVEQSQLSSQINHQNRNIRRSYATNPCCLSNRFWSHFI